MIKAIHRRPISKKLVPICTALDFWVGDGVEAELDEESAAAIPDEAVV